MKLYLRKTADYIHTAAVAAAVTTTIFASMAFAIANASVTTAYNMYNNTKTNDKTVNYNLRVSFIQLKRN